MERVIRISALRELGHVTFAEQYTDRLCAPRDSESMVEPPHDTIPCPPPSCAQLEAPCS